MPIDTETEETFRKLVGHSIRNQVDDIIRLVGKAGEKDFGRIAALILQSSAYITIYVSEGWPKDSNLRGVSKIASESAANLPVTADEIHAYLSRVVFGGEPASAVFPGEEKAALIPLYTLAGQLVAFRVPSEGNGQGWNDWLDVIEEGIETAEKVPHFAAPAVMFQFGKAQ